MYACFSSSKCSGPGNSLSQFQALAKNSFEGLRQSSSCLSMMLCKLLCRRHCTAKGLKDVMSQKRCLHARFVCQYTRMPRSIDSNPQGGGHITSEAFQAVQLRIQSNWSTKRRIPDSFSRSHQDHHPVLPGFQVNRIIPKPRLAIQA